MMTLMEETGDNIHGETDDDNTQRRHGNTHEGDR